MNVPNALPLVISGRDIDGRSVEMVRFGQLPQGADEVSDLTGIDHSDRDTRRA